MEHHLPPQGQSLIGLHHPSATCPCAPQRIERTTAVTSGRRGAHQGYRTTVTYQHHRITKGA